MAKVFDNLYPQLLEFSNLYEAWQKAAKGLRRSLFAKPVPLRKAGRGRIAYALFSGAQSCMKESPLFAKSYDFIRWLIPQTVKFPRTQR